MRWRESLVCGGGTKVFLDTLVATSREAWRDNRKYSARQSLPQGEIKEVQMNCKSWVSVLSHGICPSKVDETRDDGCNAVGRNVGWNKG
jgi:hypothetical protein